MPPIGTSAVELAYNKESIGVTSILKSTIEASKAAWIGNTRQKELVSLQTSLQLKQTINQGWILKSERKKENQLIQVGDLVYNQRKSRGKKLLCQRLFESELFSSVRIVESKARLTANSLKGYRFSNCFLPCAFPSFLWIWLESMA